MNARADALAAQLTALTEMSDQRLEALLLVVTAQGPKASRVAGAISAPDGVPRQKRRTGAKERARAPAPAGAEAQAPVLAGEVPLAGGAPDGAVVDAMAC